MDAVGLPDGIRLAVGENVSTTEYWISFAALRLDFDFEGICSQQIDPGLLYPRGSRLFVIIPNVADFVVEYSFLTRKQLMLLCAAHGVACSARDKVAWLRDALRLHGPDCVCSLMILEFQVRKHARRNIYGTQVSFAPSSSCNVERQDAHDEALRARRSSYANASEQARRSRLDQVSRRYHAHRQDSNLSTTTLVASADQALQQGVFPDKRTWDEKLAIISAWQKEVSQDANRIVVCAVCAFACRPDQIVVVAGGRVNLSLLRNDCVPSHAMPRSYNLHAYDQAILHAAGLLDTE